MEYGGSKMAKRAGLALSFRRGAPAKDSVKVCLCDFQIAVQLADARGVPHFAERFGFDLPDALARDPELAADFFERPRVAIAEAETQLQYPSFALGQAAQHVAQFGPEQAETRHVERAFGGLVLDEIAEVCVLAIAHGRLQ